MPAIALLALVFGPAIAALLWLWRRSTRRTIWEVTDTHYRQIAAGRMISETALADIGTVAVSGTPNAICSLLITDKSGMVRSRLISGPSLTFEDIRFLFGALFAARVGTSVSGIEFRARGSNWALSPPEVETRWAGRRPGLWGEYHAQLFVAPSVIMAVVGAVFAVLGLMGGVSGMLFAGIALLVAGGVLLFFSYRYLERRLKEGRLEF